jgi:hypothetical protein
MGREFIQYDQALALKELGFDEPCFGLWNLNNGKYEVDIIGVCKYSEEFKYREVLAPTFSQGFRWFREKYNIEGIPQHAEDRLWYKFHIYRYLESGKKNIHAGFEYPTYEEAEQACLDKLIEIVKNK